ncbi:MAG: phosphonatase-like hydrolase [Chloroflexota bacterium]|jgi:phosphonatase-like hydrolase
MSTLPVDLVVSDLTGTTVRDDGAILTAFRESMSKHGIPFTESDLSLMRGASKTTVFQTMAEKAFGGKESAAAIQQLANSAFATFKERLREAYTTGPMEEVAGAESTLRWLREQGVKVAATTGLDRELRDQVLDRIGWREGLFDAVVGADEVPQGRPAPYMIFLAMMRTGITDVRRVAVVGDTPLDLQAGNNSGAKWVIGVLSGAHGLETLGATPHTYLLNGVSDIPKLFQGAL